MDFQKIIPAFFDVEDKGVALVPSEFVSLATPQSPGPKEQLTDAGTQRDRVRGELCQVSYECLCPNKSDTVWTRLKLGKGTSRLVPLKVGIHGQPYKGVDQHPSPREDGGTALTRSVLATAGFVVVCCCFVAVCVLLWPKLLMEENILLCSDTCLPAAPVSQWGVVLFPSWFPASAPSIGMAGFS